MATMLRRTLACVSYLVGSMVAPDGPPSAVELVGRHLKEQSPVWADGDTATFFYQGEAEGVELGFDGEIHSLKRLLGTDVWTLAITRPELDRAVFCYRLTPKDRDRPPAKSLGDPPVWRGPKAPRAAVEAARLKGRLNTVDVPSRRFPKGRRATVYLPPGHDPRGRTKVVYAADGEVIDWFARVLEPLIETGRIPPVAVVGVHSGGYVGGVPDLKDYEQEKDLRLQEYFPGINPKRFAEHEAFFCEELPGWAEKEFAVSPSRDDRAVFGVSNGGRFAVEMGLRHPDLFGHIFGFSVAGDEQFPNLPLGNDGQPRYYLASGLWKESFYRCTSSLARGLEGRGVPVKFSSRIAGHDAAMWRDEFANALQRAFDKK